MKMTYWSIFILVVIIYVTVYTMAPENKEKNDVNLYFFFLICLLNYTLCHLIEAILMGCFNVE